MNDQNTEYLVKTYEPLYEYCKYFECGDGWLKILIELSAGLIRIIDETGCSCRASQVKEKYGTLRYYMDTSLDEIDDLIRDAEYLSSKTCEKCGEPGEARGERWVSTLCDKCVKK